MTVVVDLGAADWGTQDSVAALIDAYKPDRVYAFDPHAQLDEMRDRYPETVELHREAAWLYDGEVAFHPDITSSRIGSGRDTVACFDFSAWLANLGEYVVLKMDVEGAEYDLLERMISDGTDQLVVELLIEWHNGDGRSNDLVRRLVCPVGDWWM